MFTMLDYSNIIIYAYIDIYYKITKIGSTHALIGPEACLHESM